MLRDLFVEYCRNCFCEESCLFLLEVGHFIEMAPTATSSRKLQELINLCQQIVREYIDAGSPFEVNISSVMRNETLLRCQAFTDKCSALASRSVLVKASRYKVGAGNRVRAILSNKAKVAVSDPGLESISGGRDENQFMTTQGSGAFLGSSTLTLEAGASTATEDARGADSAAPKDPIAVADSAPGATEGVTVENPVFADIEMGALAGVVHGPGVTQLEPLPPRRPSLKPGAEGTPPSATYQPRRTSLKPYKAVVDIVVMATTTTEEGPPAVTPVLPSAPSPQDEEAPPALPALTPDPEPSPSAPVPQEQASVPPESPVSTPPAGPRAGNESPDPTQSRSQPSATPATPPSAGQVAPASEPNKKVTSSPALPSPSGLLAAGGGATGSNSLLFKGSFKGSAGVLLQVPRLDAANLRLLSGQSGSALNMTGGQSTDRSSENGTVSSANKPASIDVATIQTSIAPEAATVFQVGPVV